MRKLVAAIMLLAATMIAAAQNSPRNEAAVTVGHTFISDQTVPNTNFFDNTVHFGKGWSFGFNYARQLRDFNWGALAVEFPTIWNPDEDLNFGLNVAPRQYSSLFCTPAARVTFLQNFVISPWLSLGGGVGHFVASKDLLFGGPNPGHRIKTTGVMEGGVGFDVGLPGSFREFKFRFEARDDWSGVPPINVDTGKTRQHNYYVAGGVVFRF